MVHPDLKMDVIGYVELEGVGPCAVGVYDEKDLFTTPHFHIIGIDKDFDCSLCIKEAAYYEPKDHPSDRLSDKALEQLDEFLSSPQQQPEVVHIGKL